MEQQLTQEIRANIDQPEKLEQLYRDSPKQFTNAFQTMYPSIAQTSAAAFWQARLQYTKESLITFGQKSEWILVLALSMLAGFAARLPLFWLIGDQQPEWYQQHIGFLVFPFLLAYFAYKQSIPKQQWLLVGGAYLFAFVLNEWVTKNSQTQILISIHLPILLWLLLAFVFRQDGRADRLAYLRLNGNLLLLSGLILIAGGMVTGVTVGLFELLGIKIGDWYFQNILPFGLPAVPIIAAYLNENNPNLAGKITPVLANLFGPVVLLILWLYIGSMLFVGKDPYNDREFLLLFNVVLLGVMLIIFFIAAENNTAQLKKWNAWLLTLLATTTILVNTIALSAIVFRISQWGFSANRLAVLGANLLLLIHLIMICEQLYRQLRETGSQQTLLKTIVSFLPVYAVWVAIVCFIFPLVF
ncbi:MAG: hypothetical protein J0L83_10615 [Chitinophagales bacterium]|nr:hypothetical protein [Chitinophagales bacterium]